LLRKGFSVPSQNPYGKILVSIEKITFSKEGSAAGICEPFLIGNLTI
jgi:hypothetical protein